MREWLLDGLDRVSVGHLVRRLHDSSPRYTAELKDGTLELGRPTSRCDHCGRLAASPGEIDDCAASALDDGLA